MKTIDTIQNDYELNCKESIQEIEKKRKRLLTKLCLNIVIVIGLLALNSWYFDEAKYFVGIIIVFFGFTSVRKRFISSKAEYAIEFKEKIVKQLISFIDNRLNYHPGYGISEEVFRESGITKESFNEYYSEDYFDGDIDGVPICFAEVTARNNNGESSSDVFKGIFFQAEFNKRFTSRTTIFPDIFNGKMRRIGEFLAKHSMAPKGSEKVNLEDPEFHKYFVIFSSDQVEARYILSTSLMSRILEFKNKHRYFSISFYDNHIYIGLFLKNNLFEPTVFSHSFNINMLKEYLDTIQLIIDIVEDLNMKKI